MSTFTKAETIYQMNHYGDDRRYQLITVVAVFGILALQAVAARLWVRIQSRSIGLDDYLIMLAMVSKVFTAILARKQLLIATLQFFGIALSITTGLGKYLF